MITHRRNPRVYYPLHCFQCKINDRKPAMGSNDDHQIIVQIIFVYYMRPNKINWKRPYSFVYKFIWNYNYHTGQVAS